MELTNIWLEVQTEKKNMMEQEGKKKKTLKILYPGKTSFREWRIKIFPSEGKLQNPLPTGFLEDILKEVL